MVSAMRGEIHDASTEVPHSHPTHQFVAVTKGVAVLEDDRKRIPVYPPFAALIPGGSVHRFVAVESPFSYQGLLYEAGSWDPGTDSVRLYALGGLARALLERLASSEQRDLSTGIEGECSRLFLKLAEEESRNAEPVAALTRPVEPRVMAMTGLVERRWRQGVSIEELGRAAGYSPRHARRIFKDETGFTPLQYLRTIRMVQAAVLLADEDRQLLSVASECGYASASAFYADFKRYHGVAPGAFRSRVSGIA